MFHPTTTLREFKDRNTSSDLAGQAILSGTLVSWRWFFKMKQNGGWSEEEETLAKVNTMDGKHILRPFTARMNNHILWVDGGGGVVGATEQNPWLPLFEYFKSHLARQLFIRSQPFCHLHLLSWINDEDDVEGSQLPQKPLYEAVSNPPSAGLLSISIYAPSSFRWWFAFMNTKWQLFVTGCWRHSTHRWLQWKGAFIHMTQRQQQHHNTMEATHATTTYQTTWWCIHQWCWWWPKLHGSKVGLDYHMHKWCTSCLGQTTIPRHEFDLGRIPVKNGNASSTYYHRVDVCRRTKLVHDHHLAKQSLSSTAPVLHCCGCVLHCRVLY